MLSACGHRLNGIGHQRARLAKQTCVRHHSLAGMRYAAAYAGQ
jgi:hypothetical protein